LRVLRLLHSPELRNLCHLLEEIKESKGLKQF